MEVMTSFVFSSFIHRTLRINAIKFWRLGIRILRISMKIKDLDEDYSMKITSLCRGHVGCRGNGEEREEGWKSLPGWIVVEGGPSCIAK